MLPASGARQITGFSAAGLQARFASAKAPHSSIEPSQTLVYTRKSFFTVAF